MGAVDVICSGTNECTLRGCLCFVETVSDRGRDVCVNWGKALYCNRCDDYRMFIAGHN